MPRKVKLENKELMEKLMALFWVQGYTGTSIDDLSENAGVSKSFIYTKYGKKGIFEEVFYFYLQNYTDPFLKALIDDPRGIEAIKDKLNKLAGSLHDQTMPKACLFVNTVVEMGDKDKDIADLNEMYIRRVKKMYAKKLRYCHHIGEIRNTAYIPFYTNLLINILFSLAVLYKTYSKEELELFIASQLNLIE